MKPVSQALKPLVFLLWVAGLYLFPVKSPSRWRRGVKVVLNAVFVLLSTASLGVLVFFNLLALVNYVKEGRPFVSRLYSLTYSVCMLYLGLVVPYTTSQPLRKLVRTFDRYVHDCGFSPPRGLRFLHPITALLCATCVVETVMFTVFVGIIGCPNCESFMLRLNGSDLGDELVAALEPFAALYGSLIIFASSMAYTCLYAALIICVNAFLTEMGSYDAKVLESDASLLEGLRLRHEALCRLLSATNDVIGHFLIVVFAGGIPCFLFVVHGFVYSSLTLVEFQHMVAFFVELTAILITSCVSGAVLHLKMHKPADYLQGLNIEKMQGKGSEIVAAFLSRLQGKAIGFHVYHLFTIDTNTIMMVCGTILTYAVVIIQFQPSVGGGGGGGAGGGVGRDAATSAEAVYNAANTTAAFDF